MTESKAIGNLVASSVQLGADLAASGHAVSFAAEERVSRSAVFCSIHVAVTLDRSTKLPASLRLHSN